MQTANAGQMVKATREVGAIGVASAEFKNGLDELERSLHALTEHLDLVLVPANASPPDKTGPATPQPVASPMVDQIRTWTREVEVMTDCVKRLTVRAQT